MLDVTFGSVFTESSFFHRDVLKGLKIPIARS